MLLFTTAACATLGTAALAFATCVNGMHNLIHPFFADGFLDLLDGLPATHPRNDQHLVTRVEIVIGSDGHIKRLGVVRSSGSVDFDIGTLDSIDRAQPFGPPPARYSRATASCTLNEPENPDSGVDRRHVVACPCESIALLQQPSRVDHA